METKRNRIDETKSWFFENTNKTDKLLVKLSEREDPN
jgi:hypothetical protein